MQWFRKHILLILILFLAAFLRLYRINEYMTFLGDEGRDAIAIYNIVQGIGSLFQGNIELAKEQLTLLGPTASVGGFFMGPAYFYLAAPFFWLFNSNPVGSSVMVALLSVVTVWFIYKIGKDFFSKKAGLIAALLYTLSPLVIIYSHSSWNPNVMPFFTLLTVYILYKGIQYRNIFLLVFCGFVFGIDIQFHYVELFIGPVIILYTISSYLYDYHTLLSWKVLRDIIKDGLAILGGFLLGFSPFLAFEIRHQFLNTQSIIQFIFTSGETGASTNYLMTIWNVVLRLFGRLLVDFPLPQDFSKFTGNLLTAWYGFSVVITVFCLIYLGIRFKASFKNRISYLQISLILFWLCSGILFFGLYKKSIYDYYFEFMFPIPFLLFGGVLGDLYENKFFTSKQPSVQYLVKSVVISVVLLVIFIFNQNSPLKVSPNIQLKKTQEIADFVLQKTDGEPFNFALITGGNSDHGYRYFFIRAAKEPVTIQNAIVDPQRKTVTSQLLVVCDSLPCAPLGDPLWEIAGFGRAEIVGHWKVSYVEVYKLIHYKGK